MTMKIKEIDDSHFNELLHEGFLEVPLKNLLKYCDPTMDDVWGCGPIDPQDVLFEVDYSDSYGRATDDLKKSETYEYNVRRIAYLVKHGWESPMTDDEPILVDVGTSTYTPLHLILDGNHRVAAAKLRGDEKILVAIMGDIDKSVAVLRDGVSIHDYQFCGFPRA